jgi:hypothetical protein
MEEGNSRLIKKAILPQIEWVGSLSGSTWFKYGHAATRLGIGSTRFSSFFPENF